MAPFLDGSLPWGRFESRLEGRVVAADPAREEERAGEQLARRTRSSDNGMAGFYVWSTVGVIARLDATVAFLAQALSTLGDGDADDLRRVKAVALLANPTRAVELLAAVAAVRSHGPGPGSEPDAADAADEPDASVGPVPWCEETLDQPAPDLEPDPGSDPLDRMDAFARRTGFTPTRLPDWLAVRACTDVGRDPTDTDPGPPPGPGFTFNWSRLLPPLTLHLHLSAEDLAAGHGGVARWEGEGPVTHQFVHEHLRPLHRYVVQPVIDLTAMAPVDADELPDRLRRAVHLRTPADTFPYSSNSSGKVDCDHTEAYDATHASRPERHWSTRMGNLGPLGRFAHRIKTHGRWTVRQPFDGIYVWRDPHGQVYLVDHTGTHQVTTTGRPAGAARPFDPTSSCTPPTTSSRSTSDEQRWAALTASTR